MIDNDQRSLAIEQALQTYPFPAFRRLALYYQAQTKGSGIPRLKDLDLMQLYKIADRLVLIDLEGDLDGDHRFRWRMAGTSLRSLVGIEMTDRYLDEVAEARTAEEGAKSYRHVLRTGEPHAWRHKVSVRGTDRKHMVYARLVLPLADENGELRHLIGVYDYDDPDILDRIDDMDESEILSLGLENRFDSET